MNTSECDKGTSGQLLPLIQINTGGKISSSTADKAGSRTSGALQRPHQQLPHQLRPRPQPPAGWFFEQRRQRWRAWGGDLPVPALPRCLQTVRHLPMARWI